MILLPCLPLFPPVVISFLSTHVPISLPVLPVLLVLLVLSAIPPARSIPISLWRCFCARVWRVLLLGINLIVVYNFVKLTPLCKRMTESSDD